MVAGWDHMLPAWFSRLHAKYRTPVNSIVVVGGANSAGGSGLRGLADRVDDIWTIEDDEAVAMTGDILTVYALIGAIMLAMRCGADLVGDGVAHRLHHGGKIDRIDLMPDGALRRAIDFVGSPLVAMLVATILSLVTFGRSCGFDRVRLLKFAEESLPPIAGVLLGRRVDLRTCSR